MQCVQWMYNKHILCLSLLDSFFLKCKLRRSWCKLLIMIYQQSDGVKAFIKTSYSDALSPYNILELHESRIKKSTFSEQQYLLIPEVVLCCLTRLCHKVQIQLGERFQSESPRYDKGFCWRSGHRLCVDLS